MIQEYLSKDKAYFSNTRTDIISFIGPAQGLTVLEVGLGNGATSLEMKRSGMAASISGIDIVDLCTQKEAFDHFLIGNIETDALPFAPAQFDAIIFADVLEHLLEPQKALVKLLPFLKPGGSFYVSLPNIRVYPALIKIALKGSFEYEESGIFDKTHLRFFCKSDMVALFDQVPGVQVEKIESALKHMSSKKTLLNQLTLGLCEQLLSYQYLLKVTKAKESIN